MACGNWLLCFGCSSSAAAEPEPAARQAQTAKQSVIAGGPAVLRGEEGAHALLYQAGPTGVTLAGSVSVHTPDTAAAHGQHHLHHVSTQQQPAQHEQPSIVCRLLPAAALVSDDSSMPAFSIPHSSSDGRPQAWLRAMPVSVVDASGCSISLHAMRDVARALLVLAVSDPELPRVAAHVACRVVEPPSPAAQQLATSCRGQVYTLPSSHAAHGHRGQACMRLSSSYMREPGTGVLLPALVLQLQGVQLEQLITAARASSTWDACDSRTNNDQPDLGDHLKNTDGPVHGLVLTTAGQTGLPQGPSQSALALLGHTEGQVANDKGPLLRYKSVFGTIPSIATLLELSVSEVVDLDPAVFGVLLASGQLSGRVLLQNELSRDYWGDLMTEGKEGGSWELLVLLFHEQPDAIPDLLDYLEAAREQQAAQPQRAVPYPSWKRLVQVPLYRRRRGPSEQQVQLAGWGDEGTVMGEAVLVQGEEGRLTGQELLATQEGRSSPRQLPVAPGQHGEGEWELHTSASRNHAVQQQQQQQQQQGYMQLPPMRRSLSAADAVGSLRQPPELQGCSPPAGPSSRGGPVGALSNLHLQPMGRPQSLLTQQKSSGLPPCLPAKNLSSSGNLPLGVDQHTQAPALMSESKSRSSLKEARLDHWYSAAEPQFARPSSHVYTLLSALDGASSTAPAALEAMRGAAAVQPRSGSNPGIGAAGPTTDATGTPRARGKHGSDGGVARGGQLPVLRSLGAAGVSATDIGATASTHVAFAGASGQHTIASANDGPAPWLLGTLGSAGQSLGGTVRADSPTAAGSPAAPQSTEALLAGGVGIGPEASPPSLVQLDTSARSNLPRMEEVEGEGEDKEQPSPPNGGLTLHARMHQWSASDLVTAASSGSHLAAPAGLRGSAFTRMSLDVRSTHTPVSASAASHASARPAESPSAVPSSPPRWPSAAAEIAVGGAPILSPHHSGAAARSPRLRLQIQNSESLLPSEALMATPSAAAAAAAVAASSPAPSVSARVMKLATLTNVAGSPQAHAHTPSASRSPHVVSDRLSKLPPPTLMRTSMAPRPGSAMAVPMRLGSMQHDGSDLHGSSMEQRHASFKGAGSYRSATPVNDPAALDSVSTSDGLLKLGSTLSDSELDEEKPSARRGGGSAPLPLSARFSPGTTPVGEIFKFSDSNLAELVNGRTPRANAADSVVPAKGSMSPAAAAGGASPIGPAAPLSPGTVAASAHIVSTPAWGEDATGFHALAGAEAAPVAPRFPGVPEEAEEHCEEGSAGEMQKEEELEGEGAMAEGDVTERGDDEPELELRWHEVQAIPMHDPVTGKEAVLLLQNDITVRAIMEKRMATLTETQLTMLENMFPRHVLEFMVGAAGPNANLGSLAYQHEEVSILFMDIVGFTSMSKEVAPHLVMEYLNELFSKFDELCDVYSVYKVETAGDCYIVAGALMTADDEGFISLNAEADCREGCRNVVNFAKAMLRHARTVTMPHNQQPTQVRVGIHTGSVVSGLIGTKLPKFSLFGDTMNTSSRMESTCKPGCIQISEATYGLLEPGYRCLFTPTGGVEVKGKGLMATYIHHPSLQELELPHDDPILMDIGDRVPREAGALQPTQQPEAGASLLASLSPGGAFHQSWTVPTQLPPPGRQALAGVGRQQQQQGGQQGLQGDGEAQGLQLLDSRMSAPMPGAGLRRRPRQQDPESQRGTRSAMRTSYSAIDLLRFEAMHGVAASPTTASRGGRGYATSSHLAYTSLGTVDAMLDDGAPLQLRKSDPRGLSDNGGKAARLGGMARHGGPSFNFLGRHASVLLVPHDSNRSSSHSLHGGRSSTRDRVTAPGSGEVGASRRDASSANGSEAWQSSRPVSCTEQEALAPNGQPSSSHGLQSKVSAPITPRAPAGDMERHTGASDASVVKSAPHHLRASWSAAYEGRQVYTSPHNLVHGVAASASGAHVEAIAMAAGPCEVQQSVSGPLRPPHAAGQQGPPLLGLQAGQGLASTPSQHALQSPGTAGAAAARHKHGGGAFVHMLKAMQTVANVPAGAVSAGSSSGASDVAVSTNSPAKWRALAAGKTSASVSALGSTGGRMAGQGSKAGVDARTAALPADAAPQGLPAGIGGGGAAGGGLLDGSAVRDRHASAVSGGGLVAGGAGTASAQAVKPNQIGSLPLVTDEAVLGPASGPAAGPAPAPGVPGLSPGAGSRTSQRRKSNVVLMAQLMDLLKEVEAAAGTEEGAQMPLQGAASRLSTSRRRQDTGSGSAAQDGAE